MLTSLYVHIPFCSQICTYCDFHKEIARDSKKQDYIDALIKELTFHQNRLQEVKTIYIGGGTPTSLSLDLLEKLFQAIHSIVNMSNVIEFSIESNPNDYTEALVTLFQKYGINRVSIGVQTFHEKHLRFLGRTHQKQDVHHAISLLRNNNFRNISIDMIFSLVNQTIEELEEDLTEVLSLDIDHISYYSLILEEKSKLYHLLQKSLISMNSEDLEGLMYNKVINTLVDNGFHHYEISNFEKNQNESIHNKTYWLNKEYIGVGSGSHSMYDNNRFYNPPNVQKYIVMCLQDDFSFVKSYEYIALQEELLMGLRLLQGVHIDTINQKYNIKLFKRYPDLKDFINKGILQVKEGYLSFTRKGILIGNVVFQLFVEVL